MLICRICKTENEDHFTYCKNCGTQLDRPHPPVPPVGTPGYSAAPPAPAGARAPGQVQGGVPLAPTPDVVLQENALVAVAMSLPDPADPSRRSLQRVYVTREQYNAMVAAGLLK